MCLCVWGGKHSKEILNCIINRLKITSAVLCSQSCPRAPWLGVHPGGPGFMVLFRDTQDPSGDTWCGLDSPPPSLPPVLSPQ